MRGVDVDAAAFPDAARTYLADGTAIAWRIPTSLHMSASFAVDAELVAPVRPVLARRYGVDDPVEFAQCWTRAEALTKLADLPIITWLGRHGLGLPGGAVATGGVWCGVVTGSQVAWATTREGDAMLTRAVAVPTASCRHGEATA